MIHSDENIKYNQKILAPKNSSCHMMKIGAIVTNLNKNSIFFYLDLNKIK